jgi:quinol monooxygenase YgiN
MATFLAHIRVKPGFEAAFERTATALHDATHAAEPRMLRYEYWRASEERTYYTLASFDDFHAFLEHQTSDHHEGAGPALMAAIESIRFEWVDPIVGASPLPATDMQPLPEGASDAATKYHERFAVRDGAWWLPLREGGGAGRG